LETSGGSGTRRGRLRGASLRGAPRTRIFQGFGEAHATAQIDWHRAHDIGVKRVKIE
jgi:hypothetical protein